MKIIKNITYYISILSLIYSCGSDFSEVPFSDVLKDSKDLLPSISIYGNVTSEEKYQEVILSKPMEYSVQYADTITGATVYLEIDGVQYDYIESIYHPDYPLHKKRKGLYVSMDKIKGIPGKIHTIHVVYNSKEYSASDTMIKVDHFDFAGDILPKENTHNRNLIAGKMNFGYQSSFLIQWIFSDSIFVWNEYLSQDTSYIYYPEANYIDYFFTTIESPAIMDIGTNVRLEFSLPDNTYLTVKKNSISANYQLYLIQTFKITEWSSNKFSSIPANTITNVTNGGIGFFSAHDVYIKQITYKELYSKVKNIGTISN